MGTSRLHYSTVRLHYSDMGTVRLHYSTVRLHYSDMGTVRLHYSTGSITECRTGSSGRTRSPMHPPSPAHTISRHQQSSRNSNDTTTIQRRGVDAVLAFPRAHHHSLHTQPHPSGKGPERFYGMPTLR